jgi:regulator of replication initiation timing
MPDQYVEELEQRISILESVVLELQHKISNMEEANAELQTCKDQLAMTLSKPLSALKLEDKLSSFLYENKIGSIYDLVTRDEVELLKLTCFKNGLPRDFNKEWLTDLGEALSEHNVWVGMCKEWPRLG